MLVTAREIRRHGAPLSLAAPPAKLLALTVESGRPIVERLKERLRSR